MSRYALFTKDENLEVFVGFDDGFGKYFLTVADVRLGTEDPEAFLFHNLQHHDDLGMTLAEVAATLQRFSLTLPPDLQRQLLNDARRGGIRDQVPGGSRRTVCHPSSDGVVGWESAG